MASVPDSNLPAGARIFSYTFLWMYDFLVLTLFTNFIWRCATKTVLRPFFCANAGKRHMDIGVGTGYYPAALHQKEDDWPEHLTLVDLNSNCLEASAQRVGLPDRTSCITANVLDTFTLPDSEPEEFDSISLIFLLHCLPCRPAEKARIFTNLKPHLLPGGTVFGATVLGRGIKKTLLGSFGLWLLNNFFGSLTNWADGREDFLDALSAEYEEVEGHVVGYVLLFRA